MGGLRQIQKGALGKKKKGRIRSNECAEFARKVVSASNEWRGKKRPL